MKTLFAALLLAHALYPQGCCSDGDCFPVRCSELIRQGEYSYFFWWWEFREPRESPDGGCHVCFPGGHPGCVLLPKGIG